MKITILVVDADLTSAKLTAEALDRSSYIVYYTGDPDAAWIMAKNADLLILNPLSPGFEGTSFLEQLMAMDLRPGVILLSAYYSPEMLQTYARLGVALCMTKPVLPRLLLQKVAEWTEGNTIRLGGKDPILRRQISEILSELGMSRLLGYYECCIAIEWLSRRDARRGLITKELYPFLARTGGKSPKGVERNIRYAIEAVWPRIDPAIVQRYFGNTLPDPSRRPSNAQFLCTLAEHIRNSNAWDDL